MGSNFSSTGTRSRQANGKSSTSVSSNALSNASRDSSNPKASGLLLVTIVVVPEFTSTDRQHAAEHWTPFAAEQPPRLDLDGGEEEVDALGVERLVGEPLAV